MTQAPEFSRVIIASRLSPNGTREDLQARPEERAALAERFDLIELSSLTAQLTIQPGMQDSIKVTGQLQAEYSQRCVVTLEPIPAKMNLDIEVTFLPAEEQTGGAGPVEPEELEDEIEFYENGRIDLGETVAQQFGVNLDPYPRKPDAALPLTGAGPQDAKKPHPFAGLAEAVKKGKKQDKSNN